MVSQVVCAVCSLSPEVHTTEITFHKFPSAVDQLVTFNAWKAVLENILTEENLVILDGKEKDLTETYICSRHFTATDFAFDNENGKLMLLSDAVPTRATKESSVDESPQSSGEGESSSGKPDEPPKFGNNFATTPTVDFVTTARHQFRSEMMCTETYRLTPATSEHHKLVAGDLSLVSTSGEVLHATRKRNADLEHKLQDFQKIFKRLRSDNVLTESYVDKLKEQMPEAKEVLSEIFNVKE